MGKKKGVDRVFSPRGGNNTLRDYRVRGQYYQRGGSFWRYDGETLIVKNHRNLIDGKKIIHFPEPDNQKRPTLRSGEKSAARGKGKLQQKSGYLSRFRRGPFL